MGETGSLKTAVDNCVQAGKVSGTASDAVTCASGDIGATGSNLLGADGAVIAAGTAGTNQGVPQVKINGNGTATIQAKFGHNAAAILKNDTAKKVQWSRTADGTWSCSTDVDAKFAPAGCPATTTAITDLS